MDCLRVDYRHCAIADELKRLRIMCLLFMVVLQEKLEGLRIQELYVVIL